MTGIWLLTAACLAGQDGERQAPPAQGGFWQRLLTPRSALLQSPGTLKPRAVTAPAASLAPAVPRNPAPVIAPQRGPAVAANPAPAVAPVVEQTSAPAPAPALAVAPNSDRPAPDQPADASLPEPVQLTVSLPPPPPPVAEAAKAGPTTATGDRWLLMKALQGTWYGAQLDGHRTSIYGWVEGSFTASSGSFTNTPVVWNDFANQFLLQQAWFRAERTVVTSGTTEPTFGFRSDWLVGSDYRFTLPRGIFNGQLTDNDGFPNIYGVDPIAFYGEMYIPTICNGLDIKLGRFFTPFGVESLEAVSTPLASRSYAFNWSPPFTHTGFLATLILNPEWTLAGGLVLGNDVFIDPADEPRFVGTLKWTQPGGRNTVTLGTSVGRGNFNEQEAFNNINVFDLVWTHTINSRLSYNLEVIYGYQTNGALTGEIRADPVTGDTIIPTGTQHWGSVVNYLFYTLSPRLSGVTRVELFDDFQGARTGYQGLYAAATTGLIFKPCKSVIFRPEVRYDYNVESEPFEGKPGLFTATADVILRW